VANLTLAIDDAALKAARIRAVTEGTSVNALVRDFVVGYGRGDQRIAEAKRALLELANSAGAVIGLEGRAWTRNDLHDR
jgi:plasmid stability protein